jgi:cell division protein ZapA (FtsZ GTPase activity inhibitor)
MGLYYVDYTPTTTGTYAVQVQATAQDTNNYEITTFQVIEPRATAAGLSTIVSDLAESITSSENAITSRIGSAQSAIQSSISSTENSINNAINTAKDDIKSSISSSENSIKSSISNIQVGGVDLSSVLNEINDLDSKIASSENSINSQIASSEQSVKSAIDGVQMGVTSALASVIQPLRNDVNQVTTAVGAMEDSLASTDAGVSAASTWIIVVGIIAAIVLVLELVTLVRKLS